MPRLTERYADLIRGVLSCYDRVIIMGTLPETSATCDVARTSV
jgi:hypothetical protein